MFGRNRRFSPVSSRPGARRRGRPDVPGRPAPDGDGTADAPDGGGRRFRWGAGSLARQFFLLQVVIIVLMIAAAGVVVAVQARREGEHEARERSLAVAETFARAPSTLRALEGPDPSKRLQPQAESVRRATGVDYVVVFSRAGIRYTHPDPDQIGRHIVGSVKPLLPGRPVSRTIESVEGPAEDTGVAVKRDDGSLAGFVAVGVKIDQIDTAVNRQLPVLLGTAAGALVLTAGGSALVSRRLRRQTHDLGPAEMTRMYEHHDAVLHAVREGVLILADDGRLLLANDEARRLLELPEGAEQRHLTDLGLEPSTSALLSSKEALTDTVHRAGDRLLVVNKRLTAPYGGSAGSVVTLRDSTELEALAGRAETARGRLRLLHDAGTRLGTSLDTDRTARDLAEVSVPEFADVVTVDLAETVRHGDAPQDTDPALRRTAVSGAGGTHPLAGARQPVAHGPRTPQSRALRRRVAECVPELARDEEWREADPEGLARLLEEGVHTLVAVPLLAGGSALGVVTFWRQRGSGPFEQDDLSFAEELAARAAVSLDNARRYAREHAMAVTLQRRLLPHGTPRQNAVDVAHRYLPARAGAGGDWFDVIPLPGARVALVVGDVVGHGLHAAATMGRLRTAVHNFTALDMPPDELLSHLDELVSRIDQDDEVAEDEGSGLTGATCLYAVYDPVGGCCTLARAGHPGPALVRPDGTVELPETPLSPPLGLGGGLPTELTELPLPAGSRLVLYTDGLISSRHRDVDTGLEMLRGALAGRDGGLTPEETCVNVLDALLPQQPTDDIALLVARTRVLSDDQVAEWHVPSDPASVAAVRAECIQRLESWGLEEITFASELILSELITNAVRYGTQPIGVRLLRDRTLICEVSDGSSTSPHLRRATATDEGGRGLFLVAQFAERWGVRYTPRGKVIWAEQSLHDGDSGAAGDDIGEALLAHWDDDAEL